MISSPGPVRRPFLFERDTFAFTNELVWEYRFDPVTGAMSTCPCKPPPAYHHRCFVLARSVRQFFYHAHFDPNLPVADPPVYQELIREVIARNPRRPGPEAAKVVIPGYEGLRAFSQAQAPLLKADLGAAWESYFVRSHWRMILPTTRRHQERMVRQLVQSFSVRLAPIIHLYLFPSLKINHGIVLYHFTESDQGIEFDAYDPNISKHPVKLFYDRSARTFSFPPTLYWAGGPLNVYEMYVGGFY
jgi:hypothetical protein